MIGMKWFENLKINQKLTFAFSMMGVLVAVVGGASILCILALGGKINQSGMVRNTIVIMGVVMVAGIVIAIALSRYLTNLIGIPIAKIVRMGYLLADGDIDISSQDMEQLHHYAVRKDGVGKLSNVFLKLIESTQMQSHVLHQIAQGDLTADIVIRSDKDLLGMGLRSQMEQLSSLAISIVKAADQVSDGSRLVSDSSIALSQGATEQASAVQELTASLEEISSQTALNAQNAEKASELAVSAKVHADGGNTQMQDMLRAMEEINQSSANISKIIKVIDDIAFQTNILALNAAVEAARAGQHGKGFAVVAEEVRTLAGRSADAARETTELIEGSVRKAESGTKIARDTANALSQIVEEVDKAADLVASIASASKEQALGIEQVNQGILQVSQVVQTNAATSEESAAASGELSSQAAKLKETVAIFKLKQKMQDNRKPEMKEAKQPDPVPELESKEAAPKPVAAPKPKIALTDSEFGKY